MRKPQHIPRKEYNEIMDRFVNHLRVMDKIYKETQLAKLKVSEIRSIIDDVINAMCVGQSKFFIRQIKAYEYWKYLDLTKCVIGKMLGYTQKNYHSAVIYCRNVIEDYIATRDDKYYNLIMDIDEKIKTILT